MFSVLTENDIISENDMMSGSDRSASSTTSYSAHLLSSTSGSELQTSGTSTSPPASDKAFLSSDEGAAWNTEPTPMTPPASKPGPTSPSLVDVSFQPHQPTVFVNPL